MYKSKKKVKPPFESKISEINIEIFKRKHKWNLTALAWMDFQDVAQIIRFHIYKKWHLYDIKKPLAPWINRIISNQIKNLIRNNYSNYTRPCLKCSAAESDSGCSIYGVQCSKCPLYSNWEKSKKNAHDTKMTLSLENHSQEINSIPEDSFNIEETSKNLHKKMKQVLKPVEWKVYNLLYIEGKSEEETAKVLGYKTTEPNRVAGYKQIKNIKQSIILKAKKNLYNGEIDIV